MLRGKHIEINVSNVYTNKKKNNQIQPNKDHGQFFLDELRSIT